MPIQVQYLLHLAYALRGCSRTTGMAQKWPGGPRKLRKLIDQQHRHRISYQIDGKTFEGNYWITGKILAVSTSKGGTVLVVFYVAAAATQFDSNALDWL